MTDEIRITVIATGFERYAAPMQRMTSSGVQRSLPTRPPVRESVPVEVPRSRPEPVRDQRPRQTAARDSGSSFRLDDLESPPFCGGAKIRLCRFF